MLYTPRQACDELPFANILGVGIASTLNVDGFREGVEALRPGFGPWEAADGPAGVEEGSGVGVVGAGAYVACEQVLSWARSSGGWAAQEEES